MKDTLLYPPQKNRKVPILPDSKQSKIDLNQFINTSQRYEKNFFERAFYLKSL